MPMNEKLNSLIRKSDYNRMFECRAAEPSPEGGDQEGDMILEGKAVSFDDETELFEYEGTKVFESIDRHALDTTETRNCFLKFNHSDEVMPMARTKNGSLRLDIREDGMYIRAKLSDTTAGKDLYTLVKDGTLDKMSFAFTIDEEDRLEAEDGKKVTYKVKKIRQLYDVAVVPLPAYDNTEIYARRLGDVETRREQLESEKRKRDLDAKKAIVRGLLK